MKWNEKEIEECISLFTSGHTFEEIGIKLGKTQKSIKQKLYGLGHKFQEHSKQRYYETKNCSTCNAQFEDLKSSDRKFCSSSCAAVINNSLYVKKPKIKNKCLNCGTKVNASKLKFCKKACYLTYNKVKRFKDIESGIVNFSSSSLRRYLIEKFGECCMKCGWDERNPKSGKVPIQLDHIDGNAENNNLSNLRLLCPNCHSLTPTFGFLNKGYGREWRRIMRQKKKELTS